MHDDSNRKGGGIEFIFFILAVVSIFVFDGLFPGIIFIIISLIFSIKNIKYKNPVVYISLIGSICTLIFYIVSFIISFNSVNNIVSEARKKSYERYETMLEDYARIYVSNQKNIESDGYLTITDNELVSSVDLTKDDRCNGYVIYNKNQDRYDAYIDCKEYKTDGFNKNYLK